MSTDDSERTEIHLSSFSGPLPPADMLAKYEQVLPGLSNRIVSMAESQQSADIQHRRMTSIASVLVLVGLIVAAGTVLVLGAPIWLSLLVSLTPGSVAGVAGFAHLWRTREQMRLEQKTHTQTLQLERERHDLNMKISAEHHEVNMLEARQRLALDAGEKQRYSSELFPDNNGDNEEQGTARE